MKRNPFFIKRSLFVGCLCVAAVFPGSILWLGGCAGSEKEPAQIEYLQLAESPAIDVANPREENMADLLQQAAAGAMVQIHSGAAVGSGVIWAQTETQLVIATAGHILTMGDGEAQIIFVDGWMAQTAECQITEADVAFLVVEKQAVPEEHLTQYQLVRTTEGKAEDLQCRDGIILMASASGVGEDAYEGKVLDPWIYVESFAQNMILLQAEVTPGMSGGGLFDTSGNFLGILCGGSEDGESVAVPLSVINALYSDFSENF